MSYEITLPNGEVVDVDDSLAPEKAAELIKQQKPELFGAPERTVAGTAKDVGVGALKSAVGLPQAYVGLADLTARVAPYGLPGLALQGMQAAQGIDSFGEAAERSGIKFEQTQEMLSDEYSDAQKAAQERVKAAKGFVGTAEALVKNPSVVVQEAGESLGQMIGGAGMAKTLLATAPKIGGLVAGAVGEGLMGAGSAAEDIRERTDQDAITDKQAMAAGLSGVGTGLLGFVGGKVAQKLGINDIDTMLASGEIQATTKGFARRLIEGGISEGIFEELPQSAQEQMWANYALDRPVMEGVEEAAAHGMMAGGLVGGGANALRAKSAPNTDDILPTNPPVTEAPPPAAPGDAVIFTDTDAEMAAGLEQFIAETEAVLAEKEKAQPVEQTGEELTPENVRERLPFQLPDANPKTVNDLPAGEQREYDDYLDATAPAPEPGVAAQLPPTNPLVEGLEEKYPDTLMTREVRNNKDNFEDPNTWVPRAERRVVRAAGAGASTAAVGALYGQMKAEQYDTSAGPVVLQVGEDSNVRPAHYMKALVEEVFTLAKQFNPRGVYVLLPEDAGIAGTQDSQHGYSFKQNGVHYIVPRHLTNINEQGSHNSKEDQVGAYNVNARLQAGSTLWHEFGHTLLEDFLLAGATQETLLRAGLEGGVIAEEALDGLAPEAQALIRRWVALREAVESGKMSGHEAAARFMSPSKLSNMTLMQEQLGGTAKKSGKASIKTVTKTAFGADRVKRALVRSGNWNFWEFAAEQMSKYQMEEGRLEKNQLVKDLFPDDFGPAGFEGALQRFFEPMMKVMQKLFNSLKARGFVKAEAEYHDWLARLENGNATLPPVKAKKPRKPRGKKPKVEEEKPIDWTSKDVQATLRAALQSLVKDGVLERTDYQYVAMREALNEGKYEEFVALIEPLLEKKLQFDVVGTRARLPKGPLVKAKRLRAAGASPDQIIRATGWWLGKDGNWRYEISAKDARVLKWPELPTEGQKAKEYRLGEVLHHPKLYALYPQLKDFTVIRGLLMQPGEAYYSRQGKTIGLGPQKQEGLQTLLHEIQHAIQGIEGFAPGGSMEQFLPNNHEEFMKTLYEAMGEAINSEVGVELMYTLAEAINYTFPVGRKVAPGEVAGFFMDPERSELSIIDSTEEGLVVIDALRMEGLIDTLFKGMGIGEDLRLLLDMALELKSGVKAAKTAFAKYKRLMGEYESRATENRYYMKGREMRSLPMSIPDDFVLDYSSAVDGGSVTGTMVKAANGEPLVVVHGSGLRARVDGVEIYIASANQLDANWTVGVIRPEGRGRPGMMLPYKMQLVVAKGFDMKFKALTPQAIVHAVRYAKQRRNDGVILRNVQGYNSPIYIAFSKSALQPTSERPSSSQLRFDRTTPEGEQMATMWELLRKKLSLPALSESLAKVGRWQFWALQLQQLAHVHPDWGPLKLWEETRLKFYRKVAMMHSVADGVTRQLAWFGKEDLARLQRFTHREYKGLKHWTELVPGEKPGYWKHVPTAQLLEELKKDGVDIDTPSGKRFLRVYLEAKNALQYQQDEMLRVMLVLRKHKYGKNAEKLNAALREVVATFRILRSTPFWPQQTFGSKVVRVFETDEDGRKQLVFESASDSDTEIEEAAAYAKKRFPTGHLVRKEQNVADSILMRLPVEFVDDVATAMGLDPQVEEDANKIEEVRELMQAMYTATPMNTYDPRKSFIEGGSTEFIRNFADFSLRNSNFIAKMEFRKYFDATAGQMQREIDTLPFGQLRGDKKAALGLMQDSVKYMMDPTEEAHQLRTFIAVTYLWANVKTAVINFWGMVHTWLYLNRELGYLEGTVATVKGVASSVRTLGHEGMVTVQDLMDGAAKQAFASVTDPNWQMVNGKPTELRLALEQAKHENVLDQSYAYYLAGQALRGDLMRAAARTVGGKAKKILLDTGMAPFRGFELAVRRGTFIAVYEGLQKKRPEMTPGERYEEAVRVTNLMQGDYTKGNRAKMMRGPLLSVVTLFMTYVHNAAWGAYGGVEMGLRRQESLEGRASPRFYRSYTAQIMLLYLMAAGLEGLPFAENALDLIDAVYRRVSGDGKTARTALRELIAEQLGDDKVSMAMRGLTFDVGGVDISRSVGLGRAVPGTDAVTDSARSAKDWVGGVTLAMSGIAGGYASWLVQTAQSMGKVMNGMPLMTVLGQQAAKLPGGVGNMAKASQWANVDARGPSGGLIAHDLETGKAREVTQAEIALKALGFQPSSVSVGQQAKAARNEVEIYWTERKKGLYANYWEARYVMRDREALADVKRAIKDYNDSVPAKAMKITPELLERSMNQRKKAADRDEKLESKYKSLQKPVAEEVDLYN